MIQENSFEIFGNKGIILDKRPVSLTFGNFDGVHKGHCFLISEMKKNAPHFPVVVVTFHPHPTTFFNPENPKLLLISLKSRISLLLENGADTVIVQKFTYEFSSLTADDFCELWVKSHFNVNTIFLGHDFCYGKGRQGNLSHMKAFGEKNAWNVVQIPALKITQENTVSSSLIRDALAQAKCEEAENLLGRPYFLTGCVVKGDCRGHLFGFPTANIKLDAELVIPKYGVYACVIEIEGEEGSFFGVMNCGVRPTVTQGLNLQIEAHILDFSKNIYGKNVEYKFKKFIRSEMKFKDIEQLKEQIKKDILVARCIRDLFCT